MDEHSVVIQEHTAHHGRIFMAVTVPLMFLSLIPFCVRIYVRVWPSLRFRIDDWLIIGGFAAVITDWALLKREVITTATVITRREATKAIMQANIAIPVWCVAMTLIKTSVAITLLRIPVNRLWRLYLYLVVAIQLVYFTADTTYRFAKCTPARAAWDFTIQGARCPSDYTDVVISNVGIALNITTDVLLSIGPMVVLWRIRRPLRERILVCCLTGIGILASASSVAKAVEVNRWHSTDDPWTVAISIATWKMLEQLFALLAACSPALKGPIQSLLERCGITITKYDSPVSFVHLSRPAKNSGFGTATEVEHGPSRTRLGMENEGGDNEVKENPNKANWRILSGVTLSTATRPERLGLGLGLGAFDVPKKGGSDAAQGQWNV